MLLRHKAPAQQGMVVMFVQLAAVVTVQRFGYDFAGFAVRE